MNAHTLLALFIRTPAQLLFGWNWLQPISEMALLEVSIAAGILTAVVLTSDTESSRCRTIRFALAWLVFAAVPAHPLLLIGPGLTNSRVLYLSSVGAALLIALLAAGIERVPLRRSCELVLVAVLGLGLLHNLNAWRWTSNASQRFGTELRHLEPSPAQNTQFVFSDVPDTIRGVYFLRVGLQEAVWIAYGRQDVGRPD